MRERTILPEEKGVVYSHEGAQVLWAFDDLTLAFDGDKQVCDVLNGQTQTTRQLHASRHRVYYIA